ncbi:hypothetical protein ACO0LG_01165 [Undibacterium sp. Ji42W]|uniref:hypothetical protein n=1 Tax=Undibacterium sp. Ji42W TaxID=3413039 RepID=UPI003BF0A5C2
MHREEQLSLERKLIICLGIIGFVISILADYPAETHLSAVAAQILKISCSALGFTSLTAAIIPKNKTSHVLILFVVTVALYLLLILR